MKTPLRRYATVLAVAALSVGTLAATAEAAPKADALAVAAANQGDPTLTDVYIWATDVNLRSRPTADSPRLTVRSLAVLDGRHVPDPGPVRQ